MILKIFTFQISILLLSNPPTQTYSRGTRYKDKGSATQQHQSETHVQSGYHPIFFSGNWSGPPSAILSSSSSKNIITKNGLPPQRNKRPAQNPPSNNENGVGNRGGPASPTNPPEQPSSKFIDLKAVYESIWKCVDHFLDERYQHHLELPEPVFQIRAGHTNCIEIFEFPECKGMSLQFLNVTEKTLRMNKDGKLKEDKERLLNFDIHPNSVGQCEPLEIYNEKRLEEWKEKFCHSNVKIESKSSKSFTKPVDASCINIDKFHSYSGPPEVSLSVIRKENDHQIPTCLELFNERDCVGDMVRMIMRPCDDCKSPKHDFVKIWQYLTNKYGSPSIDVDVNSVRKCFPCLAPPTNPEKASPDIKEQPNTTDTSSSTPIVPLENSATAKHKKSPCKFSEVFSNCQSIQDALSGDTALSTEHLEENWYYFNYSNCDRTPLVKESILDKSELKRLISTGKELYVAVASGDVDASCSPFHQNKTLSDIFPPEGFVFDRLWKIVISGAGAVAIVLLIVVLIMFILLYRKKRKIRMIREKKYVPKRNNTLASPGQVHRQLNVHQTDSIDENDYVNDITGLQALIRCFAGERYEMSRDSINIGNIRDSTASILGVGEYSIAFRGTLEPGGRDVAVKTMKSGQATARSMKGALKECQVFKMLGKQERIVEFIGVCLEFVKRGELFVVMEYAEKGPLKTFLVNHQSHFVDLLEDEEHIPKNEEIVRQVECPIEEGPPVKFNTFQLFKWCWEVADAMEFLAARKIVHVSLSAKNVLLDVNYSSKISDFHLAKIPGENTVSGYNRRTNTNRLHERLIPWRWFAVESLLDDIFNTQSDVWTFAIFMWEVFSLGSTPYPEYHYGPEFTLCLKHGYRLLKPKFATIECYELMLMCWYDASEKRPTFTRIKSRLCEMIDYATRQI